MILITGVNGFIGKHLLKSLIKENGKEQIIALTSKPIDDCAFVLHNNYDFRSDLFLKSGFNNITSVIHAGAFTPKSGAESNDLQGSIRNIHNTNVLINALPECVRSFVFLSTLDVYENTDTVISEKTNIHPYSLYGHSKLFCEKMLNIWCKSNNINYKLLRIGHTYGPGEDAYQKVIPLTIKKVINNQSPEIWGDGNDLRSFIYIDDVVRMIIDSLNLSGSVGPINLVGASSCSIKSLVQLIIEISGKSLEIIYHDKSCPKRDLLFDTKLMNQFFGQEIYTLSQGIKNEYNYFLELINSK